MPLPRAQTNPLRGFLGLNDLQPGPGEIPSGELFNRSIEPSIERSREAATLASLDARTAASMQADLGRANAVRSARQAGYESPEAAIMAAEAREQERALAVPRLQQETARIGLRAQQQTREQAQQFEAAQNLQKQTAQAKIAAQAEAGRNERARLPLRAKPTEQNALSKFFFGDRSVAAAPASTVGMNVPNSGMSTQVVQMQTPLGDIVDVPLDEVEEAEAQGAVRIQ